MLGSDSGNWPILAFMLHGFLTHLEIEALHDAGMTPLEVLTAGTRTAAEMLGMADELGTIEVGKHADLLVVAGDPLQDLSLLRAPAWTIRAGEARPALEWLAD